MPTDPVVPVEPSQRLEVDVTKLLALLAGTAIALCPLHSARSQQPAGIAPCRVPVFIYQTGAGGMSTVYNGQPVILLDPSIAGGDPDLRSFTIQHECGHHANGDTLPQGMAARWFMTREQELAADCYAAHHASARISESVADLMANTQGDFAPAPGYPTGNERARNIRRCAGVSHRSESRRSESRQGRSGCPGLPPGMSLRCHFTNGPSAGRVRDFCGTGATPAPVGGPCTDGVSYGVAE